jgi:Asp-tRNA(Asn)/Glu-tRNA(Gln) amidotransferase A subunit family amidase
MRIQPAPLGATAAALRQGELDLVDYVNQLCDRIDAAEEQLQALLPEPERRARLLADAAALQAQYPDPTTRPPLYGIPLGVKDIFRADGFLTHSGWKLPTDLFDGPETACVTKLRQAGVLILGKTVTTEFAYFQPGPTRNPHDPDHTPGGSSSGSAAAVAAGFCPLALGTQTVGSVNRPAAYCGVVGFKPTYNRIDPTGLLFISRSLDHVGLFTQDVAGMTLAAGALCEAWQPEKVSTEGRLPVLGLPQGAYLEQATPEGLADFEARNGRQSAELHMHHISTSPRRSPPWTSVHSV